MIEKHSKLADFSVFITKNKHPIARVLLAEMERFELLTNAGFKP
uniref:Uncharacterized protein n=1 Tax=Siphoviridae sp. ctA995 TaxID=2826180 RepID=A0A8S5LY59_9CAUD|nr:MAG TPA: hypothetical protein [Siphoviridae sp. ctA995]